MSEEALVAPPPAPGGGTEQGGRRRALARFLPPAVVLPLAVAFVSLLLWHLAVCYRITFGPTDTQEVIVLKRRVAELDRHDDSRKRPAAVAALWAQGAQHQSAAPVALALQLARFATLPEPLFTTHELRSLQGRVASLEQQAAAGDVDREAFDAVKRRLDELDGALDLGQNERYPSVRRRLGSLTFWNKGATLFPPPLAAFRSIGALLAEGKLVKFTVASLFRVSCGFGLAVCLGVPLGLLMGWFRPVNQALNPIFQVLRPISPIAWIPVAILWFGIGELSPIFLIFLASIFPITVSAAASVRNIQPVYLRAAQNFGLGRLQLCTKVILPATLPQIITGVRIALGVAWLVVVAAEMIVNDAKVGGLGYLINDARASGTGYSQVVAGMVVIGVIGLVLDLLVRRLEKFDEIRWAYASQ